MPEPDQWEFPGGKIEAGESPAEALQREIAEELGIEVRVGTWLGRGEVVRGHRQIRLDVYVAGILAGTPIAHEHSELRWLSASEIHTLDWAEADIPILGALAAALEDAEGSERG